jgi:ubiquinone/menaquinone biosynthesis C-methylase UbiE
MKLLKHWDDNNWLSSKKYIDAFCIFVSKQVQIHKSTRVLDIGCGRGKITGAFKRKFKLLNKPIGIDIIHHQDKDKDIEFKKTDIFNYLKKNKKHLDLILIKQTIHFFNSTQIKKLLKLCKNNLSPQGVILIFSLETHHNQIPCFALMKIKLQQGLRRDVIIQKIIAKSFPGITKKKFHFPVRVGKNKYIEMIKRKYISCLLGLNQDEIDKGIQEIQSKYKATIEFKDTLTCMKYI